jgi:hypothetical protein
MPALITRSKNTKKVGYTYIRKDKTHEGRIYPKYNSTA